MFFQPSFINMGSPGKVSCFSFTPSWLHSKRSGRDLRVAKFEPIRSFRVVSWSLAVAWNDQFSNAFGIRPLIDLPSTTRSRSSPLPHGPIAPLHGSRRRFPRCSGVTFHDLVSDAQWPPMTGNGQFALAVPNPSPARLIFTPACDAPYYGWTLVHYPLTWLTSWSSKYERLNWLHDRRQIRWLAHDDLWRSLHIYMVTHCPWLIWLNMVNITIIRIKWHINHINDLTLLWLNQI